MVDKIVPTERLATLEDPDGNRHIGAWICVRILQRMRALQQGDDD